MSEDKNSESNPIMSAKKIKTDSESGARILTQKEVDEQVKNYVASLTKQLEDLTRLIQGMSAARAPSPRAGACTCISATDLSFDIVFFIKAILHLLELGI